MKKILAVLLCAFNTPSFASDADEQAIKQIIEEIEVGWEAGDGVPFQKYFLNFKGARYIKSGRQNVGLDDLIQNHVIPEREALAFLSI